MTATSLLLLQGSVSTHCQQFLTMRQSRFSEPDDIKPSERWYSSALRHPSFGRRILLTVCAQIYAEPHLYQIVSNTIRFSLIVLDTVL